MKTGVASITVENFVDFLIVFSGETNLAVSFKK
jgi:hypothetical protein